jgi:radical SAM protein with 4Fe4S-binding SPASM domain
MSDSGWADEFQGNRWRRKNVVSEQIHPFNALKLLRHADRVERMLAGEVVYPVSVELDLSLKCSHGCFWCSFDKWRQENWINFPTARALTLLEELREVGVKSITWSGGGEPLVHPDAARIISRATELGFEWGVVTNGWGLRGELRDLIARHATFVRVSLDAGTSETHQRLHVTQKPQYEQILDNIAATRGAAGARLTIGASMCIFDSNVDEIAIAAANLKAHGGDYLEVRPVYPTAWRGGRQDDSGLSDENVDRAKANITAARAECEDESFRIIGMIDRFDAVLRFRHRDHYDQCRITPLTTVISADGYIYACCVNRGIPEMRGGNVLQTPFKDVWYAEHHRRMMASIDIDKCAKCRYVGLNTVLHEAFVGDAMHANFM